MERVTNYNIFLIIPLSVYFKGLVCKINFGHGEATVNQYPILAQKLANVIIF